MLSLLCFGHQLGNIIDAVGAHHKVDPGSPLEDFILHLLGNTAHNANDHRAFALFDAAQASQFA